MIGQRNGCIELAAELQSKTRRSKNRARGQEHGPVEMRQWKKNR